MWAVLAENKPAENSYLVHVSEFTFVLKENPSKF